MKNIIEVKYKYIKSNNTDLICELTEFFDKYLIKDHAAEYYRTYLWNDLLDTKPDIVYPELKDKKLYLISFRVPGATRGSLEIIRLNENQFRIYKIHFYNDTSFGKFKCYDLRLKNDSKIYLGSILDFSNVELRNNKGVNDNNVK